MNPSIYELSLELLVAYKLDIRGSVNVIIGSRLIFALVFESLHVFVTSLSKCESLPLPIGKLYIDFPNVSL